MVLNSIRSMINDTLSHLNNDDDVNISQQSGKYAVKPSGDASLASNGHCPNLPDTSLLVSNQTGFSF